MARSPARTAPGPARARSLEPTDDLDVCRTLADQAFAARELLLHGFASADAHDLHSALLTAVLRLVVTLFAEARGLIARDHGVHALFDRLATGTTTDAWSHLQTTWRALSADLGGFFDPARHPALERHTVDDAVVRRVLGRLLIRDHQRLDYAALDIEQIGAVYEALRGYHVERLTAPAACLRPWRARGVWISAAALHAVPAARRATFLHHELGLARAAAFKLAAALAPTTDEPAILEILSAARVRGTDLQPAGRLVFQPGPDLRRTSAHYTPRALAEPVVRAALAPALAALGPAPSAASILQLKICDPAMGPGVFLLAVMRALADHIVAAWTRDGDHPPVPTDLATHARRLVASRCVHGVDIDPFAVDLARLSLWLAVGARDLPCAALEPALRRGDALVGLTRDQLDRCHWDPTAPIDHDLAALLAHAPPDHQRRIADTLVATFFAHADPRDREQHRRRLRDEILDCSHSGAPPPHTHPQLPRPFHWFLEFPDVFRDPAAGMHVFVGNPPFAGKTGILSTYGPHHVEWLRTIHPGAHGNADLAAHFFRRADTLLAAHGAIGMIATNTIGQGDTRATGLQYLLTRRGYTIHDATRDLPWPESRAAVTTAIVHLARVASAAHLQPIVLRDPAPHTVPAINSRLRPAAEHPDPVPLRSNSQLSFQGSIIHGRGFLLTADERATLIHRDPANARRIAPFIGGDELNHSPDHSCARHVIDFAQMDHHEASQWPDLLQLVEQRVRPGRERQTHPVGRDTWWQFLRPRPALYDRLHALPRCLATSAISKHRTFAFQPPSRVFSHNLILFTVPTYTFFAVVSSSIHCIWATFHSSGLETRSGYRPTDCFDNFPFPRPDPRTTLPALERLGERLDTTRANLMRATRTGLTATYNTLKDPACAAPEILALRALHAALDRAVLGAYGWPDITVPAITTPRTAAERRAVATFEDTILTRLLALNAARAADEAAASNMTYPPRHRRYQ